MPAGTNEKKSHGIAEALKRIPSGQFVLTASHEDRRSGMLINWVQQTSSKPPMIMVAVGKGRPVLAMISDSRQFGLCQLREEDRIITHKFTKLSALYDDPFLGFPMLGATATGVPILANVLAYLECQLICHMDVEGDRDLFVGRILNGQFLGGVPRVHLPQHDSVTVNI